MRNELARRNFVLEKSFAFAVGISIGANIEDAIAAQSKKDFLSKKSWNNTTARRVDRHNSPFHTPHSTLRP